MILKHCTINAYSLRIPSVTLPSAFLSDRYALRGIMIIPLSMLAVVGFAVYLSDVALSLIQILLC